MRPNLSRFYKTPQNPTKALQDLLSRHGLTDRFRESIGNPEKKVGAKRSENTILVAD